MLGREAWLLTGSSLGNPPFRTLVEAAAAGAFAGLSLWPAPTYQRARSEGHSDADLRAMLADHGLVVNDVDARIAWVGPDDPGPPYREEPSERELFAAAEALGARCCNVLLASGSAISQEPGAAGLLDAATEVFAGICDRAAAHGLVATLEFSPGSAVRNSGTALAIAQGSGRPNAGILLDTWHCHHGPTSFEDLRALPGSRVLAVQLSDVPAVPPADLAHATRRARLVPGEGAFDWTGFLDILSEIRSRAPLTVEVLNDELAAAHPPRELARRLGDAVRALSRSRAAAPASAR
jgi:sugar phosphate isomerase/epimerase